MHVWRRHTVQQIVIGFKQTPLSIESFPTFLFLSVSRWGTELSSQETLISCTVTANEGVNTGQSDMNLCSLGWRRWDSSLQGHKLPTGGSRIRGPKSFQHQVKMCPPTIPVIKHPRLRGGSLILFLFHAVLPREYESRLPINRRIGGPSDHCRLEIEVE